MQRQRIAAALAAGTVVVALGACSAHKSSAAPTTTAPPTYTITGTMALHGSVFSMDGSETISYTPNGPCWGINGYDDMKEGAEVVVSDATGKTIGNGALEAGQLADDPAKMADVSAKTDCSFAFVVRNLPRTDFYKIEVAHRGQVTYSFDQLASNNWVAELSLGS